MEPVKPSMQVWNLTHDRASRLTGRGRDGELVDYGRLVHAMLVTGKEGLVLWAETTRGRPILLRLTRAEFYEE